MAIGFILGYATGCLFMLIYMYCIYNKEEK